MSKNMLKKLFGILIFNNINIPYLLKFSIFVGWADKTTY